MTNHEEALSRAYFEGHEAGIKAASGGILELPAAEIVMAGDIVSFEDRCPCGLLVRFPTRDSLCKAMSAGRCRFQWPTTEPKEDER